MVTVLNGGASSYVLTDLRKYTKYEFFLVPFYKSVEGPPSNSQSAQTLEDGILLFITHYAILYAISIDFLKSFSRFSA